MDKTGTITVGKPQVTDIISIGRISENEILRIAAGLEDSSEHPLALAVINEAKDKKITPAVAKNSLLFLVKGYKL